MRGATAHRLSPLGIRACDVGVLGRIVPVSCERGDNAGQRRNEEDALQQPKAEPLFLLRRQKHCCLDDANGDDTQRAVAFAARVKH